MYTDATRLQTRTTSADQRGGRVPPGDTTFIQLAVVNGGSERHARGLRMARTQSTREEKCTLELGVGQVWLEAGISHREHVVVPLDYLFRPAEGSRPQPKLAEPGKRREYSAFFFDGMHPSSLASQVITFNVLSGPSNSLQLLQDFSDKAWTVEPNLIRKSLTLEQKLKRLKTVHNIISIRCWRWPMQSSDNTHCMPGPRESAAVFAEDWGESRYGLRATEFSEQGFYVFEPSLMSVNMPCLLRLALLQCWKLRPVEETQASQESKKAQDNLKMLTAPWISISVKHMRQLIRLHPSFSFCTYISHASHSISLESYRLDTVMSLHLDSPAGPLLESTRRNPVNLKVSKNGHSSGLMRQCAASSPLETLPKNRGRRGSVDPRRGVKPNFLIAVLQSLCAMLGNRAVPRESTIGARKSMPSAISVDCVGVAGMQ
ncbi:hypothetical protein DFH06DRAFT_1309528 [Mycena polygramma]|nr:hypothetical protein DFH06DRAFT_1309528 [Mycena polygramma]